MYESARVDMITNQADKQKFWEVKKSWIHMKLMCKVEPLVLEPKLEVEECGPIYIK